MEDNSCEDDWKPDDRALCVDDDLPNSVGILPQAGHVYLVWRADVMVSREYGSCLGLGIVNENRKTGPFRAVRFRKIVPQCDR